AMPCLAEEIMHNGVAACSQDPRFPKVEPAELASLEYSVDVLTEPERISSAAELDVRRFGVIVEDGDKRGLLLPDLDGIDDVAQQIAIAKRKAGIAENVSPVLYRFEVVRHR
ncbi:MAG: AMMECR1 domain-containing protein, partial [Oscillospiraceae bacterium]